MAVKIQVKVFWVVMLYDVVVGYHRYGGPCCLHLQVVVTSTLCGITTQKTLTLYVNHHMQTTQWLYPIAE